MMLRDVAVVVALLEVHAAITVVGNAPFRPVTKQRQRNNLLYNSRLAMNLQITANGSNHQCRNYVFIQP
jgi:hypothetical protein